MVYSDTTVCGGNQYGKCISGHLHIFPFFKALNDAFEVQIFFRASFLHLIKDTDSDSM